MRVASVTRVLSGAVLIIIAVGVVWFAHPLLFLAVAEVLLVLAFVEYARLAAAGGLTIPIVPSCIATMLVSVAIGATQWHGDRLVGTGAGIDAVLMSALVVLAALTLPAWKGGKDALGSAAAAVFPLFYLGLPIGAMLALRTLPGREALFLLMLTVMVSDTAQYYSGRAFGKRLLAPAISPKKTIEGAVGGFVVGTAFFTALGAWWLPSMPIGLRVGLGLALVALGIAGDLFESMLKRSAGVKDSSALIPGHGGVLDRIDALLFAAPIYYIVLKYL